MGKLMVVVTRFLSLCAVLLALPADAATFTKFDNFAVYEAGLGGLPLETQDFEGFVPGTNLNNVEFLPGVSVTSNMLKVEVWKDHSLFAFERGSVGDLFYDINFSQPYNAVGFNIESFDPATPGPAIIDIFFDDQTGASIDIFPTNATETDPIFFGVIADTPIARIRLTEGPELAGYSGNEEVALDDFAVSPTAQAASFRFNIDSKRGWQSTGVKVTAGQQLTISAKGSWSVDSRNFSFVGPDGYSPEEDSRIFQGCKLDPILPYGILLVKVGDDPSFWVIGSGGTFRADRDGFLAVRIHDADACLGDNDGTMKGKVTGSGLSRREPTGQAPNLIVLVHGCCTNENDVKKDWDKLGNEIAQKIKKKKDWEIVVWDWHKDKKTGEVLTPKHDYIKRPDRISPDANTAYKNAEKQGHDLSTAILDVENSYEHVHLIGHSAGARLIDTVAIDLFAKSVETGHKPFIHLTFLDAYTPHQDELTYGSLADYAEHYVDRTFTHPIFDWIVKTNELLTYAFDFDITDWQPDNSEEKEEKEKDGGHQWPRYWYKKSVTSPGFRCGFALSVEGGNNQINSLPQSCPI